MKNDQSIKELRQEIAELKKANLEMMELIKNTHQYANQSLKILIGAHLVNGKDIVKRLWGTANVRREGLGIDADMKY